MVNENKLLNGYYSEDYEYIGKNFTSFILVFECVNMFSVHDKIRPVGTNYSVNVNFMKNRNGVYLCNLNTVDPNLYLEEEYIAPDTKWELI